MLRLATAALIVRAALLAARFRHPEALPLAAYAVVPIAIGQITNSPQVAFFPWLAAGAVFALASEVVARRRGFAAAGMTP
jgi:hypothetical protein